MHGFAIFGGGIEQLARWLGAPPVLGTLILLLGAVFAVSGVAKLRNSELASLALVDLGIASRPRPAFGTSLAIAEIGLALTLLLAAAVRGWFAISVAAAVAVLLMFFGSILAAARSRGTATPCFCFGSSEGRASWWGAVRAWLLGVAALWVVVREPNASGASAPDLFVVQAVIAASSLGLVALLSSLPRLKPRGIAADGRRPA